MLNEILAITLFLFILNNKNKLYEGTMDGNNRELCSEHPGLKAFMFNENCDDNHRYKVIKNCIGSDDSLKDCKLCKEKTYGQCKPTFKGGYCEKNGEKTDANGEKLKDRKIGRDISNFTGEELENFDSRAYDEMKNECNPFRTRRDRDEEDDFYNEDEDDRVDRIDRRSHRRHRRYRRRNRRNNDHHIETNESKLLYYVIGIVLFIGAAIIGYLFKKGKLTMPKFSKDKNKVISTSSN